MPISTHQRLSLRIALLQSELLIRGLPLKEPCPIKRVIESPEIAAIRLGIARLEMQLILAEERAKVAVASKDIFDESTRKQLAYFEGQIKARDDATNRLAEQFTS